MNKGEDMVERVAKAAWEFEHPRDRYGWDHEGEETRLYYMKKARHDMAAMREPTEAMVERAALKIFNSASLLKDAKYSSYQKLARDVLRAALHNEKESG